MALMFYSCIELKEINLSSFDARNVNNIKEIFCNCYQLKEISVNGIFYSFDIKNFNLSPFSKFQKEEMINNPYS